MFGFIDDGERFLGVCIELYDGMFLELLDFVVV